MVARLTALEERGRGTGGRATRSQTADATQQAMGPTGLVEERIRLAKHSQHESNRKNLLRSVVTLTRAVRHFKMWCETCTLRVSGTCCRHYRALLTAADLTHCQAGTVTTSTQRASQKHWPEVDAMILVTLKVKVLSWLEPGASAGVRASAGYDLETHP